MSANPEIPSPKTAARRARKQGKVVSAKMAKTVVVEVTRFVKNARYGRIQKRTVRFLADDRVFKCQPGDVVEIEETRPLSARKRWRVKTVVTRGPGVVPQIADEVSAS
ncbi:MAG: 30S ribosomal protein S17 [Thermoanaerobaculia bacterium]